VDTSTPRAMPSTPAVHVEGLANLEEAALDLISSPMQLSLSMARSLERMMLIV
jgi:hypothetical protein